MWIENLDIERKWLLFDVIYRYNLWLEYKIDPKIEMIFWFFKPFFDSDKKAYDDYCDSRRKNWIKWGRPPITEEKHNLSIKPKKATKAYKPTDNNSNSNSNYSREYVLSYIDIEKYKKEYPKKNIDIEFDKMFRRWENEWKKIKKPNTAFTNRLGTKEREPEYVAGLEQKTDDQRITEFLNWKSKFNDKYGWDRYQEVKELRTKKCLSQPLSL